MTEGENVFSFELGPSIYIFNEESWRETVAIDWIFILSRSALVFLLVSFFLSCFPFSVVLGIQRLVPDMRRMNKNLNGMATTISFGVCSLCT